MVSTYYSVFLVLLLMKHAQSLRYNFGDGSYYVGSVDNQGRPSGRGQYHNSSGDLGNFQTYYPFMPLLLQVLQAIQDMLQPGINEGTTWHLTQKAHKTKNLLSKTLSNQYMQRLRDWASFRILSYVRLFAKLCDKNRLQKILLWPLLCTEVVGPLP